MVNVRSDYDFGVVEVLSPASLKELSQMLGAIDSRVDTLEWRLDKLCAESWSSIEKINALIQQSPKPMIITLRPQREYGAYHGSEAQRLSILALLASYGPTALDIEHDVDVIWVSKHIKRFPQIKWIRSWHAWKPGDYDLDVQLARMYCEGVCTYKLVVRDNTAHGALRLLDWLQDQHNVIAHAMGPDVSFSRVMARVYGSCAYYCGRNADPQLGMLSLDESFNLYHMHLLNRDSQVYALLGENIRYSLGAQFHNDHFYRTKKNAVYVAIACNNLEECLAVCYVLGIAGLSITMPYKQLVLAHHCVKADESVNALESCNTLVYEDAGYRGFNTDVVGLNEGIGQLQHEHCLEHVGVIGLGGLGSVVCRSLARQSFRTIQVWNRSYDKVEKALLWGENIHTLTNPNHVNLWINTLPQAHFIDWLHIHASSIQPGSIVWNMNYNQDDKHIIALLNSCFYQDGLALFYSQAKAQQDLWF